MADHKGFSMPCTIQHSGRDSSTKPFTPAVSPSRITKTKEQILDSVAEILVERVISEAVTESSPLMGITHDNGADE